MDKTLGENEVCSNSFPFKPSNVLVNGSKNKENVTQ